MSKIYLKGGFGNVLFQTVHYLFLLNNGKRPVLVDTLTKENILTNCLKWKIHSPIYKDFLKDLGAVIKKETYFKTLISSFYGLVSKLFGISFFSTYFFSKSFNNKILIENSRYFGYFQNKRYLISRKKEINKILKTLSKRYGNRINQNSFIAIHYRYGDSYWARQHEDYYHKVKENIKCENNIIVFTDSIDRAKLFFLGIDSKSIQFVSKSPIDDFSYMLSAQKLYCAPSTFSWWAANCLSKKCSVVMPEFLFKKLYFFGKANLKIM